METLFLFPLPLLIIFIALHILTGRILRLLLNLPPTPFPTLPFIGHLYLVNKPFHKSLSKLSSKYGPVLCLRLGRVPAVIVSSPTAAHDCLIKNDVIFANRPIFLNGKHYGYNYTSVAWSSYGELWRNLRRITSLEILCSNKIRLFSDIRSDEVQSLIRRLFKASVGDPARLVALKSACFDLTFNLMTRMIIGKRYYGENVENSKEAEAFNDYFAEMAVVNAKASVLDFLPFMRWFGLKGVENMMKDVQRRRDEFMQSLIDEHRTIENPGGNKNTMISVLLALHENEPEYYSDQTIKSLMLVLHQAGSDTTASTMEWAMAHLIDNPSILKKAQAEIDNVVGQERLISESDLPLLPYVRCIINETLRLHAAAPLLIPHRASQDCVVGGFKIRAETVLYVNVWDIHHNPKYWDEPEKFRPERFEGLEIGFGGGKEELKFLPFGSGRRGCPGDKLAMHVLGLALGSLIQCFNWETEDGRAVDLSEGPGTPSYKAQPMVAKCSPRPNMFKLLSLL